MAPRAALFDMDRTLLSASTAILYTRYRHRRGEIGWAHLARVALWHLQYTLGVVDAERVARLALQEYQGKPEAALAALTESWFTSEVLAHVRAAARRCVSAHRAAGDTLAIVTGATPYVARPLARELGIEHVVASDLEVDVAGRLTGRLSGPICFGIGKLRRTEEFAQRFGLRLEDAIFYSDSITDVPLLERVGTPVAVCPDRRLRRFARQRGWRIEDWYV